MRTAVTLISLASLVGCATDTEPLGESTSNVEVNNKLSANKLSANKLSANKLSANKLSANKLSANKLQLNQVSANDLLATAEGREVLAFIVSCAIAGDQSLIAEHEGETYEFFGEVGLANSWLHHPIDDRGAGWVSACLFARVNAFDLPLPISLRGNHPALATSADEQLGWPFQEGAFYGNFFTDEDEALDWNACRGDDHAEGDLRECAEPCTAGEILDGGVVCVPPMTRCGYNYAGDCGVVSTPRACNQFSDKGTFYTKCAGDSIFDGSNQGYTPGAYHQVITVYLTQ